MSASLALCICLSVCLLLSVCRVAAVLPAYPSISQLSYVISVFLSVPLCVHLFDKQCSCLPISVYLLALARVCHHYYETES